MRKKDRLFAKPKWLRVFQFNKEVAEVFDDMAERSIPFYKEVLRMSAELCYELMPTEGVIYDLGCSTGNFLQFLLKTFPKKNFHYIGIDNSPDMIQIAKKRYKKEKKYVQFLCADVTVENFANASAIVANYTLQFVPLPQRKKLIQKIYNSLFDGGIFLVSEKIYEENPGLNTVFQELYYEFKKRNQYSEQEIARKREALEKVLIPQTIKENIKLLEQAGFRNIALFFKWYNFASFIAIKS